MPHELVIRPNGRPALVETPSGGPGTALANPLVDTFAESASRGLPHLGASEVQGHLPPPLDSARSFARTYLSHHGGAVAKRRKPVQAFRRENGVPFFVPPRKAADTGLNLAAASQVIHFGRWWDPAVEDQATDRAWRMSQKRNVLAHEFACRGTGEGRTDALHLESIEGATTRAGKKTATSKETLAPGDLAGVFGIEPAEAEAATPARGKADAVAVAKKPAEKRAVKAVPQTKEASASRHPPKPR